MDYYSIIKYTIQLLLSPLIVGFTLWWVGDYSNKKKIKVEAIKELMAYRGDNASDEFRRSLNKVSIIFHNNNEIRLDIRNLYEIINNSNSEPEKIKRSIVGLIYKLCQNNGFKGITEYDIDQAFPENKQSPDLASGETKNNII